MSAYSAEFKDNRVHKMLLSNSQGVDSILLNVFPRRLHYSGNIARINLAGALQIVIQHI